MTESVPPTVRVSRPLAAGWKFSYGRHPDSVAPAFDDTGWFDVGVPHSFGIPTFLETDFYVGHGAYRLRFDLSQAESTRRTALEFHGVFQHAVIFVNGERVGAHDGGYTAFEVDISRAVRSGENLLVVHVDNEWDPRLAPRAGEHVFNGGIYRDVALLIGGRERIDWYGTFVRTRRSSEAEAELVVETEVSNGSDAPLAAVLTSTVIDPQGNEVASVHDDMVLAPGGSARFERDVVVGAPTRWSIDTPSLYTLRQTLHRGATLLDAADTSFGIREVEFTADRGFFLNGKHVWITGANVHQDHAGWGDAVTRRGMQRDVALVRQAGMNLIRGSHYPHHDHFATECDRQGVLFWSEVAFWGIGGENSEGFWDASAYPVEESDREAFEASCLQQLEEMIRVGRNHPSIVCWSTGNEVFFSDDAVMPAAKELTVRLAEKARALDPSRPVAVGGAQRGGFDGLGDIAGYNGDGAALYPDPGFPNIVSEYGSLIEDRPGRYEGRFTDGTEIEHAWRSGVVLWCAFHHGSIVPEMGRMGFIDYFRVPLRSYYWYRERLRGIAPPEWPRPGTPTALRLTSDRESMGIDGLDDVMLRVEAIDAEGRVVAADGTVVLTVQSGPGLFPTGRTLVLSAASGGFLDGTGAIELRAYAAGETVVTAAMGDMTQATISVTSHGARPWSGVPLRLPDGPPSRVGLRGRQRARLLSEKRPAFASSSREGYAPGAVTDPSSGSGWRSSRHEAGQWVRIDLEGLWEIERIEVDLLHAGLESAPAAEVLLDDAESMPSTIFVSVGESSFVVDPNAARARSVIVRFPGRPADVRSIRVHGR